MPVILKDWKENKTKGRLIMLLFRIANLSTLNPFHYYILLPYRLFYTFFVEWVLGIEIQWRTNIGKNCKLFHGQSLVVHGDTIIGENCTLRQCTTIGSTTLNNGENSKAPIIGNNVDIGSNVCIIGPITIGNNVKIGSGTVIVKNIPSNCTVVGNPAKIIEQYNP